MLLGSYSAMSAFTQESLDKLLALNKNTMVICQDRHSKAIYTDKSVPHIIINYLDVSDQDLSDLDLSNIDFYNCNFYGTKFIRTNLRKVTTFQCDFRKAHFEDANLYGSTFEDKSPLDGATFKNANIGRANLEINRSVHFEDTDRAQALRIKYVELFEETREKEDRSKYILKSGVDIWPYDAR